MAHHYEAPPSPRFRSPYRIGTFLEPDSLMLETKVGVRSCVIRGLPIRDHLLAPKVQHTLGCKTALKDWLGESSQGPVLRAPGDFWKAHLPRFGAFAEIPNSTAAPGCVWLQKHAAILDFKTGGPSQPRTIGQIACISGTSCQGEMCSREGSQRHPKQKTRYAPWSKLLNYMSPIGPLTRRTLFHPHVSSPHKEF